MAEVGIDVAPPAAAPGGGVMGTASSVNKFENLRAISELIAGLGALLAIAMDVLHVLLVSVGDGNVSAGLRIIVTSLTDAAICSIIEHD